MEESSLRPHRLFPSERRAHFTSYRACDRARGPHMVSDRHGNRWFISPTHGSPPQAIPSSRHCSPAPLPAHHSKSTSSYVGSPPSSPVPLACVYCGELGYSVWHFHDYNRPCSPNSSQVHPWWNHIYLFTAYSEQDIPSLAIPPLPRVTFNQRYPTIPSE